MFAKPSVLFPDSRIQNNVCLEKRSLKFFDYSSLTIQRFGPFEKESTGEIHDCSGNSLRFRERGPKLCQESGYLAIRAEQSAIWTIIGEFSFRTN